MLAATVAVVVLLVVSEWWLLVGVPYLFVGHGYVSLDFTSATVAAYSETAARVEVDAMFLRAFRDRPPFTGGGWTDLPDFWVSRFTENGIEKMRPVFEFPAWLVILSFAAPTAFLFWRNRRPPSGHCQRCGYDLRGSESGTCSECGHAS